MHLGQNLQPEGFSHFEALSSSIKGRVRGDEKDLSKHFYFFIGVTQLLDYKLKVLCYLNRANFKYPLEVQGFNFVRTVEC